RQRLSIQLSSIFDFWRRSICWTRIVPPLLQVSGNRVLQMPCARSLFQSNKHSRNKRAMHWKPSLRSGTFKFSARAWKNQSAETSQETSDQVIGSIRASVEPMDCRVQV